MNHDEAVGTSATERYLLHELPDDDRDAFEEHYFECAVCANDVQSASAIVDTLPAVLHPKPVVVRHRAAWHSNFAAKLATAATVIMASMLGWMQVGVLRPLQMTVAEMRQPHVLNYHRLKSNRGDQAAQAGSSRTPFTLEVPVPPDGSPKYACLIIDARGIIRYSLPVAAAQTEDYVRIEIPAGALPPGNYTLRVDGRRPKIAEYPFTVG